MLSSHQLTAVLGSALQEWRATIQPVPVPLVSTRKQAKAMAAMADGPLHRQSDGYPIIDDDFIAEQFGAAGIEVPTDPMTARLAGNALTAGMAAHYLETAAVLARQGGLDHGLFKLPAGNGKRRPLGSWRLTVMSRKPLPLRHGVQQPFPQRVTL